MSSDEQRVEFAYQCECGKRMSGWAISDAIVRQELERWKRDGHQGHAQMSVGEYQRARRRRPGR